MTGPLVLPDDVQIVPLSRFPSSVRVQVGGEIEDYAITRPRSRVPSKVIDAQAAALLREFAKPTTLVDAILRFATAAQREPQEVLEAVYPFLENCLLAKLLVVPGSSAEAIQPTLSVGDYVAEYRIEAVVQVLADTELYRVSADDQQAALKIARPSTDPSTRQMIEREARILERLHGEIAPHLLRFGVTADGRAYIATEWISGETCAEAAAALRTASQEPLSQALVSLCGSVLDAYAKLHSFGVIHADVHFRNLLVEKTGAVRIIDYGLSRGEDDSELATAPRGGVGFFLDPECAAAGLSQSPPPQSSRASEQYSVAALIYYLLTGHHYLDFSYEMDVMLRQIVEQPPTPLAVQGLPGCTALDKVLGRALSKDSSARFPDVKAMAAAFRQAVSRCESPIPVKKLVEGLPPATSEDLRYAREWLNSFLDSLSDPTRFLPSHAPVSVVDEIADIAYGLFRIACVREDAKLSAVASRWLDRALRENQKTESDSAKMTEAQETVGLISSHQSSIGIACIEALMAHATGDTYGRDSATKRFLQLSGNAGEEPDIVTSKSSTLLLLSLMLEAFRWEPASPKLQLKESGNQLLASLWQQLDWMPAIAESRADSALGMAHGWAGYLYATLRWIRSAQGQAPANLGSRLEQLAEQFHWHGPCAWCSFRARPNTSGGWCNGSAGHVFLWSAAYLQQRDTRWLRLAEGCGQEVRRPREEGYDLCCGLAGKAYSQLHLYKHTGDRLWLDSAASMAVHALRQAQHADKTDRLPIPFSLYQGKTGLAVLLADLERPECSAMPLLEEEGWPSSLG
jgi:eukaryotic-like serine/threonine-protein kinase